MLYKFVPFLSDSNIYNYRRKIFRIHFLTNLTRSISQKYSPNNSPNGSIIDMAI